MEVGAAIQSAAFSIASICTCLMCIIYTCIWRRTGKLQNKLFIVIVVSIGMSALMEGIAVMGGPHAAAHETVAAFVLVSDYIYFVVHTPLAPLLLMYATHVTGLVFREKRPHLVAFAIPFAICELLALTNPFTEMLYYHDSQMGFHRSWGMYSLYAVMLFYLAASMVVLLRTWRTTTLKRRRSLLFLFSMVLAGVGIQLFFPGARVELFAESLATLGVMLSIENEDDATDVKTGLYNRLALERSLRADFLYEGRSGLILIELHNLDFYQRILGVEFAYEATREVAGFLAERVRENELYQPMHARFALKLTEPGEGALEALSNSILARFDTPWIVDGRSIELDATIMSAHIPSEISSFNESLSLIMSPLPSDSSKKLLTGKDLGYLQRKADVERAIERGFEEGTFEVYYQPINDAEGTIRAAEALMRLHDRELGEVPPSEFIAVAEQAGTIDRIGDFALDEVCSFVASGVPKRYGISSIGVNLSVIQCMHRDFVPHVENLIQSHGIEPSDISLEITESVAARDYRFLLATLNQLKTSGHHLSMDDFGTGYSNMHSVLTLSFDTVKIDKSILWDAEHTELGRSVLASYVRMLHDIGRTVLVEGVETHEQVELLRELGVDYYQGYYFAKPMRKDDFVNTLSASNGR